jgi:hypothetical protein
MHLFGGLGKKPLPVAGGMEADPHAIVLQMYARINFFHIPSDLVVDRGASTVRGACPRYFPCAPSSQLRNLSENNLNNLSNLKIYH